MIFVGKNITQSEDLLSKVDIRQLHQAIRSPKSDNVALIRQLRIIYDIDRKQYSLQKRRLPYFVCGTYLPPVRRSENFASTDCFVVDVDHLSSKEIDLPSLRQHLSSDPRVMLLFSSPSGDGLKILFSLSSPCYDRGLFTIFYKHFVHQLSVEYHLEQVIDTRTCDVTRACFLSYDPEAYLNLNPVPIDLNAYITPDNSLDIFQPTEEQQDSSTPPQPTTPVADDTIAHIKQILSLAQKAKRAAPPIVVPQQLTDIIDDLTTYISASGAVVDAVENIQYGKKIKSHVGKSRAETNVFYGKRGFSVVMSPKSGTDPEVGKMIAELIQSFFDAQV